MKLHKLTFIECPGIEGPVSQSYDSDYKASYVDDILRATNDGTKISPLTLAEVSSSIMRPIGPKVDVDIAGGWRERRFKFAMVVETNSGRASVEYRYIVGYTDRIDGVWRGDEYFVDPDTRLYFDKIVKIDMRMVNHGSNTVWQPTMSRASQVLRRDALVPLHDGRGGRRGGYRDDHYLLRPTDLFRRRDYELSDNSLINTMRNHPDVHFENKVGALTQSLQLNDIFNNSATNHLSRSISALVSSSTDPVQRIGGRDNDALISGAVDRLDEPTLDSDPYLNYLRRDCDIIRDGYITLKELLDNSPDWNDDDTIVKFSSADTTARYADTSRWGGDNASQIAARILANGLPTILLNAGYSMANGIIINTEADQFDRVVKCMWPGGYVEGVDVDAMLPYFEDTIDRVLLREATHNGMFSIEAKIDANIDTEITIDISVDGGPWEFFVYPAWGSGLVAPVQTLGSDSLDNLSHAITSLATDVATARSSRLGTHTDTPRLITSLSSSSIRDARDSRDTRDDRDDRRGSTDYGNIKY